MAHGNRQIGPNEHPAFIPLLPLARLLARQAAAEMITVEAVVSEALSSPPQCDEERFHASVED